MIINYFKIKNIDTKNIENKLKIISNSDTENAEYITRVFEKTINYLFKEETISEDILQNNISKDMLKEKTVVYFDTIKTNNDVKESILGAKEIIIIGNHENKQISDNIKLINIKKKSEIKKSIKNKEIIIGFNIDNIDFSKYYYNNMSSYYLNVLNSLNELNEDKLKRDTEEVCTQILLNKENFVSKNKEDENHIQLKKIIKTYERLLKHAKVNKINEKYAFYNASEITLYETKLINELSDLVCVLNMDKKEMISKIYDIMCKRMHEEAMKTEACSFKDDKCAKMRYTDRLPRFRKKRLLQQHIPIKREGLQIFKRRPLMWDMLNIV